jgi:hypothetical protein
MDMTTYMTGPETGLRELGRCVRWTAAFQSLCLFDWLIQDCDESRRWAVKNPQRFFDLCNIHLGWTP